MEQMIEGMIQLDRSEFVRLGMLVELAAQGHSEEISYSDVVRVLLDMASQMRTSVQIAEIVYEETV